MSFHITLIALQIHIRNQIKKKNVLIVICQTIVTPHIYP